jgi:hypothetical protein
MKENKTLKYTYVSYRVLKNIHPKGILFVLRGDSMD